jgi:hypothetical protein
MTMPSITGSFTGKITKQNGMPLADHPNHELSLAEVTGTQESPDPLWNGSRVTYWAVTDVQDGKGTQTGYYNNVHGDKGRDWGTFEGKVTVNGEKMTVEGTFKIAGGDGEFRGVTGSGKFTTMMKSETEIDCAWEGKYTLAKAKAHAR